MTCLCKNLTLRSTSIVEGYVVMKKGIFIILAVISLLSLVACVPQAAAPAAPAQAAVDLPGMQKSINDLSTWKQVVADPAIAKISTLSAPPAVDAYTKAQADTAIKTAVDDAISQLKKDKPWTSDFTTANNNGNVNNGINYNTGTGQNTQFTPGQPASGGYPSNINGGIVSQVNWVQGNSQMFTSPTGSSGTIWYTQRLINESTTIQYVRPTISLGLSSQYNNGIYQTYFAGLNIQMSSGQGSVSGIYMPPTSWAGAVPPVWPYGVYSSINNTGANSDNTTPLTPSICFQPTAPYTFTLAPGIGQPTNNLIIIPSTGLGDNQGEFYIAPSGFVDTTVQISNVSTSTAVMWNLSAAYSANTNP